MAFCSLKLQIWWCIDLRLCMIIVWCSGNCVHKFCAQLEAFKANQNPSYFQNLLNIGSRSEIQPELRLLHSNYRIKRGRVMQIRPLHSTGGFMPYQAMNLNSSFNALYQCSCAIFCFLMKPLLFCVLIKPLFYS